ncbi:hypothetical protein AB0N14_29455 [Streptomyces sp. NPDC051104]|uniref:hypothetical protein n=1 Tax=Streptomyces sp. NPDC051104 TaxID=3155044 RepID=UPI00343D94E8
MASSAGSALAQASGELLDLGSRRLGLGCYGLLAFGDLLQGRPGAGGEEAAESGVGVAVLDDDDGVAVAQSAVGEWGWFPVRGEQVQVEPFGGEQRTGDQGVEAFPVVNISCERSRKDSGLRASGRLLVSRNHRLTARRLSVWAVVRRSS